MRGSCAHPVPLPFPLPPIIDPAFLCPIPHDCSRARGWATTSTIGKKRPQGLRTCSRPNRDLDRAGRVTSIHLGYRTPSPPSVALRRHAPEPPPRRRSALLLAAPFVLVLRRAGRTVSSRLICHCPAVTSAAGLGFGKRAGLIDQRTLRPPPVSSQMSLLFSSREHIVMCVLSSSP